MKRWQKTIGAALLFAGLPACMATGAGSVDAARKQMVQRQQAAAASTVATEGDTVRATDHDLALARARIESNRLTDEYPEPPLVAPPGTPGTPQNPYPTRNDRHPIPTSSIGP